MTRSLHARSTALVVLLLALSLAVPNGAGASAPRRELPLLEQQIGSLSAGRAILRYDPARIARSDVVARLEALGLDGTAFVALPMVAATGTRAQLVAAARQPGIVAAHMDEGIEFEVNESAPLVFDHRLAEFRSAGFDGHGVNVAILDSGVDGIHRDLADHVVRNVKFLDQGQDGIGLPTYVECPGPCNTDTTSGHGTHVAGIAAGDGTISGGLYTGVAPEAGIVGLGAGDGANIFYAVSAFDYLLTHPELGVVAVNNSWGRSQSDGRGRYDSTHPVNVATRALYEAGVSSVFSAGNTGTGDREDEPGASRCDTVVSSGRRVAGPGVCRFTVYGSAPWAISVAAGRKDRAGSGPGGQYLAYFSSRGDPDPQISLDGEPVVYLPTLTAPGVNVRAARNPNGVAVQGQACASAEPPACAEPPAPQYEAFYVPLSGTSMAAPHVTGAIAVIQSAARELLGRLLTPDEVKSVLVRSASPMTEYDGFWDWPCGGGAAGAQLFIDCGTNGQTDDRWTDLSGTTYEPYQVGAGYLNVATAVELVRSMQPPTPTTICHWLGKKRGYAELQVTPEQLARHERHGRDIIPAPPEGCPTA